MERQHSSWEDFVNYEIDQLVATEKISFESLARIGEGYLIGRLEQRTSLDSMQRPAVIFTCYQALPPIFPSPREVEPLDIRSQAEPRNQFTERKLIQESQIARSPPTTPSTA